MEMHQDGKITKYTPVDLWTEYAGIPGKSSLDINREVKQLEIILVDRGIINPCISYYLDPENGNYIIELYVDDVDKCFLRPGDHIRGTPIIVISKKDKEFIKHFDDHMAKLRASNAPMGSHQTLKDFMEKLDKEEIERGTKLDGVSLCSAPWNKKPYPTIKEVLEKLDGSGIECGTIDPFEEASKSAQKKIDEIVKNDILKMAAGPTHSNISI